MDDYEKRYQKGYAMLSEAAIEWGSNFYTIEEDHTKYARGLTLKVYNDKEHKSMEWKHCLNLDSLVVDTPEFKADKVQDEVTRLVNESVDQLFLTLQQKYGIDSGDVPYDVAFPMEDAINDLVKHVTRALNWQYSMGRPEDSPGSDLGSSL